MKNRIKDLSHLLNQYRKDYYTNDKPQVSDSDYDKLYRELVELEKNTQNTVKKIAQLRPLVVLF